MNRIPIFLTALIAMHSIQEHPAIAQVRNATAYPIHERIRIDGKLDEPAWQSATPIGPLIQVVPKEGGDARERTDVRILVDEEALYFGITCYDHDPSAIITTQLTRDGTLSVDDHVTFVLDPFFDHRNGFFFDVNAAGARTDGQISNNSDTVTVDWDGIWNAHARITNEGWIAEIVIPFKTLRFRPGQSTWGFNIQRDRYPLASNESASELGWICVTMLALFA